MEQAKSALRAFRLEIFVPQELQDDDDDNHDDKPQARWRRKRI